MALMRTFALLPAVFLALLFAVACGGDDAGDATPSPAAASASAAAGTPSPAASPTVAGTPLPIATTRVRLRISRFFASRVLEIHDNRLITTHHNITTVTPIRDVDELEAIVHEALQLPRMPVRAAVEALRARGVDIFAGGAIA